MPKYNTKFDLSLNDMDVIETALRGALHAKEDLDQEAVTDLLGRLHNQKTFFRPQNGIYVGG